jgi:hypothetical protein
MEKPGNYGVVEIRSPKSEIRNPKNQGTAVCCGQYNGQRPNSSRAFDLPLDHQKAQASTPGQCWQRVAVEEEKGCLAMEPSKRIERSGEAQDLRAECFPFLRARFSSFRLNSMLCSSSLARSSVDADDRLPVPVFEKSGSGL